MSDVIDSAVAALKPKVGEGFDDEALAGFDVRQGGGIVEIVSDNAQKGLDAGPVAGLVGDVELAYPVG